MAKYHPYHHHPHLPPPSLFAAAHNGQVSPLSSSSTSSSPLLICGRTSFIMKSISTFKYDPLTNSMAFGKGGLLGGLFGSSKRVKLPLEAYELCTVGERVFALGENYYSKNGGLPAQVYEFNTSASSWDLVATTGDVPEQAKGLKCVGVGNDMYAFTNTTALTEAEASSPTTMNTPTPEGSSGEVGVYVLDTTSMSWRVLSVAGSAPVQRAGSVVVSLPGTSKILMFGGVEFPSQPMLRQFTNHANIFDAKTNTWEVASLQGDVPAPRSGLSATLTSVGADKPGLIVAGGKNGWSKFDDVYRITVT
eukprot:TRINITY_DN5248_c0_g1_i3.p1 TRINITY_DN5248_c0_g1~~TRINITY_DN5248_c0_g1_i3.p1  ORF type:complete len:306 (-),score=65.88 TRINITY_DN5248_c0_g1_i3:166-1083(-)